MATRRSGKTNAFWDNAAVGVNEASVGIELPRGIENLAIFITVSAATTISLEASHSGNISAEGVLPDSNAGVWMPVYYLDTAVQAVMAAAGSRALMVPDFSPGWIRLRSSAAATITAGWEATAG